MASNNMTQIENDQYYMAQALRLAEKGLWTTDPNPRTGCVIVNEGKIVGEGWHEIAGGPHAEVRALQMAKDKAKGATCYVTLEPCCHHGRTPPCTDALIKAGISRVVFAMTDPNPLVSKKGAEQLIKAGIKVDVGVLNNEAEQLNTGFFMRMRHGRPYVRSKIAMSVDGRIAMSSGESQWITSNDARRDVQTLRARSSALLTGAGTVLSDNPRLTVRQAELPDFLPKPSKLRQPTRVIVDTHLSMPLDAQMLQLEGQTVIFTTSTNDTLKTNLEKVGAKVVVLSDKEQGINLEKMCEILAKEYEINELMVETGTRLNGALLRAGLIDELVIYMAPVLLGNDAKGLFNLPQLQKLSDGIQLDIKDIRAIGRDWRITASPIYR